MPYFYVNADKKPYRLSGIDKDGEGKYLIYASRWEEHWKKTLGGKSLVRREHHYTFAVPSLKKKLDIKFDNTVYSCKKANQMTLAALTNHLSTLLALEQL